MVRNSNLDGWSNGVWNQVFSGDTGAPAQSFPARGGPYTTLAAQPGHAGGAVSDQDAAGNYSVFVPAVQHNSSGPPGGSGPTPGTAHPDRAVLHRQPQHAGRADQRALALGKNLILTPGVYT